MKNFVLIVVTLIVVAGLVGGGYFLGRSSQNNANVQAQMTSLRHDLSTLQSALAHEQVNEEVATGPGGVSITGTIARVGPVVVRIDVAGPGVSASGSGTIIDKAGYVLTNQHVIDRATSIKVTLETGEVLAATIVKSDTTRDVALLKMTSTRTDFPAVTLGSSANAVVGDDVLALGFPLGQNLPGPATVTRGIVSAVRTLGNLKYVQIDAVINPGNSGGCLVNFSGEMIGIPTSGVGSQYTDIEGLGLAVPIDDAMAIVKGSIGR